MQNIYLLYCHFKNRPRYDSTIIGLKTWEACTIKNLTLNSGTGSFGASVPAVILSNSS